MQQAVEQLNDSSSTKRRSAAKRLRALADPATGPALLRALHVEIADPRTWETQYQMVMALGECHHAPAMALLEQLAAEQSGHTMLGVALGDALVRIRWATDGNLTTVDRWAKPESPGVSDGVFRALAMLRLVPDEHLIDRILDVVENLEPADPLRFWVVVAAARWQGPRVKAFMKACVASPRAELSEAAASSLAGRHMKPRVL